jgi:hypothetical protein
MQSWACCHAGLGTAEFELLGCGDEGPEMINLFVLLSPDSDATL